MAITAKQKLLKQATEEILSCEFCNKHKQGLIVPGEGDANAKVVFVGEAPGKNEVVSGRPFIGRAGKLLRGLIEVLDLKAEEVFITSAVKYLPIDYITPKPSDIEHGRNHLFKQLTIIKPRVIVLLGNVAAVAVLNERFQIAKSHGTTIQKGRLTYFLSYHPAAPLYDPKLRPVILKDFKKLKKLLK